MNIVAGKHRVMTASLLLQLSLYVVTIIQLTSSQSTQDADTGGCGRTDEVLNQLMTVNSQLMNAVLQLQRDVAELKTGSRQKNARGKLIGP